MEQAQSWINKYELAITCKDFKSYASLFTDDIEYHDRPLSYSIGDEKAPNGKHAILCKSMEHFLSEGEAALGDIEIACVNDNTAVYRFGLGFFKEHKEYECAHSSYEFVVIVKFRDNLCRYYYQTYHKKGW